jgi:hypothetical protein
MTASQGEYASQNCFAGLTATDKEYISKDNTAKTIAGRHHQLPLCKSLHTNGSNN